VTGTPDLARPRERALRLATQVGDLVSSPGDDVGVGNAIDQKFVTYWTIDWPQGRRPR
jgi:hypothetical protein